MKTMISSWFRGFRNHLDQRLMLAAICMGFGLLAQPTANAQVTGAIFTTDSTGTVTNENVHYEFKSDVYLNGGPASEGSAALPVGFYYCKVTTPNGGLLGKSLLPTIEVVDGAIIDGKGQFAANYQLTSILFTASSLFIDPGYDTTTNPGGEYKVWISMDPTFPNNLSKTDNFKVDDDGEEGPPPPDKAELCAVKFYDANVNGIFDLGEVELFDWQVLVSGTSSITGPIIPIQLGTPSCTFLDPGTYSVFELDPIEDDWVHTTDTLIPGIVLLAGEHVTVEFGNVCLGAGGGKTLGFWSNKNGQKLISAADFTMLSNLNLRKADGTHFNPASYSPFRTWLLGGNATNMAYMLSVQLAAMELNVFNGLVNGSHLVYAPQLLPYDPPGLNDLGFISVNDLMTAANIELGLHGLTKADSPDSAFRAYQAALKDALDDGNNNLNFVQALPCPYSFLSL